MHLGSARFVVTSLMHLAADGRRHGQQGNRRLQGSPAGAGTPPTSTAGTCRSSSGARTGFRAGDRLPLLAAPGVWRRPAAADAAARSLRGQAGQSPSGARTAAGSGPGNRSALQPPADPQSRSSNGRSPCRPSSLLRCPASSPGWTLLRVLAQQLVDGAVYDRHLLAIAGAAQDVLAAAQRRSLGARPDVNVGRREWPRSPG